MSDSQVSNHLEKIIASLKKSAELALKYDANANLDEFLTMAAEAAEVDIQNTHTINAMDSAAEAETEEDFDRIFHGSEQVNCDAQTIKRHPIYKDFEQFTRNLLNKRLISSNQPTVHTTVSNEMEITETTHAIDPLTKGPLIRPVRNRHCNHVYGYQSVMDSLEINRRLRCPMIGCSNKQYLIEQDLIEI